MSVLKEKLYLLLRREPTEAELAAVEDAVGQDQTNDLEPEDGCFAYSPGMGGPDASTDSHVGASERAFLRGAAPSLLTVGLNHTPEGADLMDLSARARQLGHELADLASDLRLRADIHMRSTAEPEKPTATPAQDLVLPTVRDGTFWAGHDRWNRQNVLEALFKAFDEHYKQDTTGPRMRLYELLLTYFSGYRSTAPADLLQVVNLIPIDPSTASLQANKLYFESESQLQRHINMSDRDAAGWLAELNRLGDRFLLATVARGICCPFTTQFSGDACDQYVSGIAAAEALDALRGCPDDKVRDNFYLWSGLIWDRRDAATAVVHNLVHSAYLGRQMQPAMQRQSIEDATLVAATLPSVLS